MAASISIKSGCGPGGAIPLPAWLWARNGFDLRTYEKEGVEYLDTESYRCMEASSAPALWGGPRAYTTIQAGGCARWYRAGDLAADL